MARLKPTLSRAPTRRKPREFFHNMERLGAAVFFVEHASRLLPPKEFDRFMLSVISLYIVHRHERRSFNKAEIAELKQCEAILARSMKNSGRARRSVLRS